MKRYCSIENEAENERNSSSNSKKQKKKLLKKLLTEAEERKRRFNESKTIQDVNLDLLPCTVQTDSIETVNQQTALTTDDNKSTVQHWKPSDIKFGDGYESSDDSSSSANVEDISGKSQIECQKKDGSSFEKAIGYTILGETNKLKKRKVQRVLPDWLANPFMVPSDLHGKKMPVSDFLNLDSTIHKKLKEAGIMELFPVQQEVVPQLIDINSKRWWYRPNDMCVSAPTGSGKTLAFVLPVIQSLKDHVVTTVRCLAVLPVRDLAVQVYNVFKHYCKGTTLCVTQITGVTSFAEEQALLRRKGIRGYHSLADIVIATPGRLIDHIHNTPGFSLQRLRFLILDEADRMMDEIQQGWLIEIEKAIYGENPVPSNCCNVDDELFQNPRSNFITACSFGQVCDPVQKLLYSATLSQDSEKIEQLSLFCPKLFVCSANTTVDHSQKLKAKQKNNKGKDAMQVTDIEKYITPVELKEYYILCELSIKPLIVWYLIKSKDFRKVLCFTKSVESSHRLYLVLKEIGEHTVSEFSSRLSGIQRKKAIKKFLSGSIKVLVCSDIMARGMDIEDIDCVILYDIPAHARTYVHRVGRTARAGKQGTAITLMANNEKKKFLFMMKSISRKNISELYVSHSELEPFQQRYQIALKNTANSIGSEHHQEIMKKHLPRRKKNIVVQNVKDGE